MKSKRLKLFAFLFFILGIKVMNAQNALPSSGGNASGDGGSASYTIGQLVYTTINEVTGSEIQGVQHPYEIFVVAGIENIKGTTLKCSVYPNPTDGYIILETENYTDVTHRIL